MNEIEKHKSVVLATSILSWLEEYHDKELYAAVTREQVIDAAMEILHGKGGPSYPGLSEPMAKAMARMLSKKLPFRKRELRDMIVSAYPDGEK
jgi:hypothetical protein